MLPSIRLVISAIFAAVVLMIGGFGLVATFQIATTSTSVLPREIPARDSVLANRPEQNSTGAQPINKVTVVDMPNTIEGAAPPTTNSAPADRSHDDEAAIGRPAIHVGVERPVSLSSPSGSEKAGLDQSSNVNDRPGGAVAGVPVVAFTEGASDIENGPIAAPAATEQTAPSNERLLDGNTPAEDNATGPSFAPSASDLRTNASTTTPANPASTGGETTASPSGSAREAAAVAGATSASAETATAAGSSPPAAAEMATAASSPSTEGETGTAARDPSSAAVEAAVTPTVTPAPETPKATATAKKERIPKGAKPESRAKKVKTHQAIAKKAKTRPVVHVRSRRVRPATQTVAQPQNPASPFGNFFGSQ
jgi:hypothetical protein